MLDRLAALPFWLAFAALFASGFGRSNATYWIGRGAIAGYRRRRHAPEPQLQARAEALLRRLGPVAVTLSYLTIGIQTAIHLTAGVMRMPLRYYLPAALVGSLAWAAIYATVGLAVVQAWIAAQAGSWYGLAGLGALVLVGVCTWLLSRRRSRTGADAAAPAELVGGPSDPPEDASRNGSTPRGVEAT